MTSEDQPGNSIINIGQNTEKSPGDLRRLTVIQTEKPSVNACVKNSTEYNYNNNNYLSSKYFTYHKW